DSSLTIESFAGEQCWIGVDLAQRDDLAAIAAIFCRDDQLFVFTRAYLPKEVIAQRAWAVPQYREWMRSGELIATDGSLIDLGVIESDITAWCRQFNVQMIVADQYSAFQLVARLEAAGLPAVTGQKTAKTF